MKKVGGGRTEEVQVAALPILYLVRDFTTRGVPATVMLVNATWGGIKRRFHGVRYLFIFLICGSDTARTPGKRNVGVYTIIH